MSEDAELFADMVHRYGGMVYGTCLRVVGNVEDARDATQECFLALAGNAGAIRGSPAAWLHGVAVRRATDAVRRNRRRRVHERKAMAERAKEPAGPLAEWEEIAPHVDEALWRLPEDLRDTLIRHFLQGRTQAEIAETLRVDQSTVSRRLSKGVELLRVALKRKGVIVPAALLASLLGAQPAQALPAALGAALGRMAMAGVGSVGAAGAAGSWALIGGVMAMKVKLIVAAAVVLAVGTTAVVVTRNLSGKGAGPSNDASSIDVSSEAVQTPPVIAQATGGPADMESVVALWSRGDKEEAMARFLGIDWEAPANLSGNSFFALTEKQFQQLARRDPMGVQEQSLPKLEAARAIAREVIARAQRSNDAAEAQELRGKVRSLGVFLSQDPDGVLIRKLCGEAIVKVAEK
jgi:RNA polymerase sigma factor (sigma-70 family)